MEWNFNDNTPIYLQIVNTLNRRRFRSSGPAEIDE